jgi:hypothetical protein
LSLIRIDLFEKWTIILSSDFNTRKQTVYWWNMFKKSASKLLHTTGTSNGIL